MVDRSRRDLSVEAVRRGRPDETKDPKAALAYYREIVEKYPKRLDLQKAAAPDSLLARMADDPFD